ncbi:hypothetical protein IAT38_002467 [Cryptococcus sp. DSM 104549]
MRLSLPTSHRLAALRNIPWRPPNRSLHSSAPCLASKKTPDPNKSSFQLSAMSASLLGPGGKSLPPLAPLPSLRAQSKAKRSASPKKKSAPKDEVEPAISDDEAVQRAIDSGEIPRSPLALEVFINSRRFPDCILLTRVGKFYESYFQPAIKLSSMLGLRLAEKKYGKGENSSSFPFAGFPVPALDKYLKILVQDLGHTVVLVEEYDEDGGIAHLGKKVTAGPGQKERRVYRVVTPGTMVDEGWLDQGESRYLLAVALGQAAGADGVKMSLAYTDASTGEFFTKDTTLAQMEDELTRIAPREVVLDSSLKSAWQALSQSNLPAADPAVPTASSPLIDDLFSLLRVIGVHVSFADPYLPPPLFSPSTPSPNPMPTSTEDFAIALLRHHLIYALRDATPELSAPAKQHSSAFMQIDAATLQALEIRHALRPGGLIATGEARAQASPLSSRGTLISVLAKTITPSAHRLLIRTLTAPSTSVDQINSRLALVQAFVDRQELRLQLRDALREVGDVVRIVQRFRSRRGTGRDIWDVREWLRRVGGMMNDIAREVEMERRALKRRKAGGEEPEGVTRLDEVVKGWQPLTAMVEKIERSLDENAIKYGWDNKEEVEEEEAAGDAMMEGAKESGKDTKSETKEEKEAREAREKEEKERAEWWIFPSFSPELQSRHNELTALKKEQESLQKELIKKHSAKSLTLEKGARYGYHVQVVAKDDAEKLIRARSFERIGGSSTKKAYFTHNGWAALGVRIEILTEHLGTAQRKAARELQNMVVEQADIIQRNAELLDELDLSMSFAQNAVQMNWVRPILNESTSLNIAAGRHPSIESSLLTSSRIFTPNSTLMSPFAHLHIITGPNQGGKSTLLRQTAVIAILAQSGSFVPADRAEMGVVDRVFSRVGARDDLWRDRSTFMLEMVETAAILKHATPKSLVIMDEIGRGTTLQAGISIAYATLDHILRHIKCRTLFATHYHELGAMLGYQSGREEEGGVEVEMRGVKEDPELGVSVRADGEAVGKREGVAFWCTDVDEEDGTFSYSYKLRPGINFDSHAIKAASIAGMPEEFLRVAEETLAKLQAKAAIKVKH